MAEDLVTRLRAPCGESLTLLVAEGGQEKFDPLRLAAAREIERLDKLVSEHCQAAFEMGAAWGTQSKEIERLRAALERIAQSGAEHPWGGPAAFAREVLASHETTSAPADTSPLVGCGNWKPKHGTGPYCGNCGFHESEHRDTHPYTRTVRARGT